MQPDAAVDKVIETTDQYDDKRIILHMMQPHRPFLGSRARGFEQAGFSRTGVNRRKGEDPEVPFWWDSLEQGIISREEVMQLYRDTLRVALSHVQRLVDYLSGKSVISADHGNVFGARGLSGKRLSGHPSYKHHPGLNIVPWLEINKPRKKIVEGDATVESRVEHYENATAQLEALGYIE